MLFRRGEMYQHHSEITNVFRGKLGLLWLRTKAVYINIIEKFGVVKSNNLAYKIMQTPPPAGQ